MIQTRQQFIMVYKTIIRQRQAGEFDVIIQTWMDTLPLTQ